MKCKNVSLRSWSTVATFLSVFVFALSSNPGAFGQNETLWVASPETAGEGGNWTDPAIWEKEFNEVDDEGNPVDHFPDDTYPGDVTTDGDASPDGLGLAGGGVWVNDIRNGFDNPVVVDTEISFNGQLDAPEGGAGNNGYLRIAPGGSLTVNGVGDSMRFGVASANALLEVDGGSLISPAAQTWMGSWNGSAEVNIDNGGLLDMNFTLFASTQVNSMAVMNIHDGTFATNRLEMAFTGTAIINLFGGEMQVRGPINGEPATFTIGGDGGDGNIHLVDGLLRANSASLDGGLDGDTIAAWIAGGNITGEWSSADPGMVYTGWDGLIRWNDTGDEVIVWAIPEPGMFEGPTGQDQFLEAGDTAEFSVTATVPAGGGDLSFQWQVDGEDIPGATDATLTLDSVTGDDTGEYTVVVTEDLGEAGEGTTSASAQLLVVDTGSPALLNVDMAVGATMSGYGMLRPDGLVEFVPEQFENPEERENVMEIGEGDTVWNGLAASSGSTTYTGLVDSRGLSLTGVSFTVSGATGSGDEPVGGGIEGDAIDDFSGPLLRDYVNTTGDDQMTLILNGLQDFAGRDITLVVYALGPQSSSFDPEQDRDDIATISLADANNPMELDPVVTDTVEGRDLSFNEGAFAAFEGRVSGSGTVAWTVGPVPGTPGFNAMNGFQILITNEGEPLSNTPREEWRMTHFGSPENSGMGADDADYDGDGTKNLIEYSIGSDPTVPGDASEHLNIGTTAQFQPGPFDDDFEFAHDFIAGGVADTGWDRITGVDAATGPRIEAQNGPLHMTSSDTTGDVNPLTIARNVPKGVDLQATVQLLDAPSDSDDFFERAFVNFVAPQLYIGRSDNPSGVSHYVSAHFFDAFGLGNGMQVVEDFSRTFDGSFTAPPAYPWMRIEFIADTGQVTAYRSTDGEEWEEYGTQTLAALTAVDAELEIGLLHTTWSGASPDDAFVEFDNFEIRGLTEELVEGDVPHLSLDFDVIGDPSLIYVIEDSDDLNEEWNELQVFGPFADPGPHSFIDGNPIGTDPERYLRLNVIAD